MEIEVLFFGVLAEFTGIRRKHYSGIQSYSDLMHRICDEFPGIDQFTFNVAVNRVLVTGNPFLKDGDELAVMPPFAGG